LERARQRAEASFLDFVELMWPVLDPGQPFVRGRVQEAIAQHLEAVSAGKLRNLLMNVPPGSTKTYLANVFWPAWEWGPRNRPDLRYMSWSYSPDLALQANDDCRKVIKSEVYQRFWGDRFQLDETSDAKGFFRNDRGGWRRSSSVRGASTGFRADRLIFDDPHNVKDADSPAALLEATRWFSKSLPTRVRNMSGDVKVKVPFWVRDVHGMLETDPADARPVEQSVTVGIMQRVHLHDISGIILKNPSLGYEVLLIEMRYKGADHPARRLPTWRSSTIGYQDWRSVTGALADPIRFPDAEVTKLEAQLMLDGGSDAVAAQLDQWPLEVGGSMFKIEWLPDIAPAAAPGGDDKRGWDWAASEAKTAAETADARVRRGHDGCWYLMDSDSLRGGPGEVDDRVRERHASDPRTMEWSIPRDPGAAGVHFANYVIRQLAPGRFVDDTPETGSKVTRAKPVSGQARAGNFKIVRHPGWETTRQQLIDFPYGELADRVAAISRAFAAHVEHPVGAPDHGGYGGLASETPVAPRVSPQNDWCA
jgi:predicted phage terminase large subunit-like protein